MRGLVAAFVAAVLGACTPGGASDAERVATTQRGAVVGPLAATPLGMLVPASPGSYTTFGGALAVDGDTLAAGAPTFDDFAPRRGAIFMFRSVGGEILQTGVIGLEDRPDTILGGQVALEGGRLATEQLNGSTGNLIAVYYRENSGAWFLDQRLAPETPTTGIFAASLAMSKDTIVVGAPVQDGAGPGSAYVFVRGASRWSEQARLVPGSGSIQPFGSVVAVEDDVVAVGFPANTLGPSVWIFERSAGRFTEVARLAASDATPRDLFGQTLAISKGRLYVGAPNAEAFAEPSGAVYEFTKIEGSWQQSDKLSPSPAVRSAEFGAALAADWPWLLVGAPLENDGGAAYLFSTATGEFLQELRISASLPQSHDEFGRALALSGNFAAIGAPGADNFGVERGAVHPYAIGLMPGQPCTTSAECGGYCADGICCDRACDRGCETCRAAEGAQLDGVCTALPTGSEAPLCFPILCAGEGICPQNCTTAGCHSAYWCDALTGECRPRGVAGAACTEDVHCKSDVCEHGTCCDKECSGCFSCRSVLTASTDGVCAPVLAGTDPNQNCTPDTGFPENCGADGRCDGGGQCRRFAPPTTACGPTVCNGETISGKLCNGQGGCALGSASCTPNQCRDGVCGESCHDDRDCAGNARCSAGNCVPKRPIESPCRNDAECASGFCTDGVCCNARCDGQCEFCRGAGTVGICTAIADDPAPGRPACQSSTPGNACATARCDGNRRDRCVEAVLECGAYACDQGRCKRTCSRATSAVDCARDAVCIDPPGRCIQTAVCEGDHLLLAPGDLPVDCTPYRCDPASGCRSQCSSALECASGFRCNSRGECVRRDRGEDPGCACRSAGAARPAAPVAAPILFAGFLLLAHRRLGPGPQPTTRRGKRARSSAAR